MCDPFTQHVRDFGTRGADASFGEFWDRFQVTLRSELHARNLWHQSPSLLDYPYIASWQDPDGFAELASECYFEAVLRPMNALKVLVEQSGTAGGAVRQNIRDFLTRRQRKGNPRGMKIFQNARAILEAAIRSGLLAKEGDGEDLDNGTVLRVGPPGTRGLSARAELERFLDNDEDWMEVVRTITKSVDVARGPLLRGLEAFRASGIAMIRLGELIAALRKRADAAERLRGDDEEREIVGVFRMIWLDSHYEEEEESREVRIRRIREGIDRLPRRPGVKGRIRAVFDRMVALDQTRGKIVWAELYTEVGISRSTFWEYIDDLRSIVKEIEAESCG